MTGLYYLKNKHKISRRRFSTHKVDTAAIDVSFISLLKVIPKVLEFLTQQGEIVALIKPQFEVGRKDVAKAGYS